MIYANFAMVFGPMADFMAVFSILAVKMAENLNIHQMSLLKVQLIICIF